MATPLSIFLDFNLPNSTTWYYFSFLLAVALFCKFSRLLSIRNLDVVLLFLLGPGLLIIQAARPQNLPVERQPTVQIASLIGHAAFTDMAPLTSNVGTFAQQCGPQLDGPNWLWIGYLWLLLGSLYFFCRCLFDLTLVQRPALGPNLQIGGLAWLAGALLICLLAVAYKQAARQINAVPGSFLPDMPPQDQAVFAVAVLWQDWPAWAVATLAFLCHIVITVGLFLIGWRHYQDLSNGMAAATLYLLLPYTGQHVGQLHHVLPMALFIGTLLAYRVPTIAGAVLGLATAATYFPVLVLPVWLSFYRERGAGRFLAAFLLSLGLCWLNIGMTLWLNDALQPSLQLALESPAWQPWKDPQTEGFWTGGYWVYRIPIFLLHLCFIGATMFWPAPKNLAHVIALSAAIFIGLQFWGADQGGMYILWYMPLLLLLIFRPNLQDRVAQPIPAETDWLMRGLRWMGQLVRRIVKKPEPAQTMTE